MDYDYEDDFGPELDDITPTSDELRAIESECDLSDNAWDVLVNDLINDENFSDEN